MTPGVLFRRLHLDNATTRKLTLECFTGRGFRKLVGSEHAAIRAARATIRQADDAAHTRLELGPGFV